MRLLLIAFCLIISFNQRYDRLFFNSLPPESEILTLKQIINSTSIAIYSNMTHKTSIKNEPFQELNQQISVNITYSLSEGFESDWSPQKANQQRINILLGNQKQIIQQQSKSPIHCEVSRNELKIRNLSFFSILEGEKSQSQKQTIITNYQQLLNQDVIVLDLWRDENKSRQNRTFIIMSDGYLVVLTPGVTEQDLQLQRIKIYEKEISDGSFNIQRYEKQRKIYIFLSQVQVEIIFSKLEIGTNYKLNFIQIQKMSLSVKINNFQWILNQETSPKSRLTSEPLLVLTFSNCFCLYRIDPLDKIYKPVNQSMVGSQKIAKDIKIPIEFLINKDKTPNLNFQTSYYWPPYDALFIFDSIWGIISYLRTQNNTFQVLSPLIAWSGCSFTEMVNYLRNHDFNKPSFFMNCNNVLRRVSLERKDNKILSTVFNYNDIYIPKGQIMISYSKNTSLIFIKGQTKITAFASLIYPKFLKLQNTNLDNLFVFGNQIILINNGKMTFGEYYIEKGCLICRKNINFEIYDKKNQKPKNQDQLKQKQAINNEQIMPLNYCVLIQYLAECNQNILSTVYSLPKQLYRHYKFCRYKKVYTDLYLTNQANDSQGNDSKVQIFLIASFAVAVVIFFIGFGIWWMQKKKIDAFIQEGGLPETGVLSNINFKTF